MNLNDELRMAEELLDAFWQLFHMQSQISPPYLYHYTNEDGLVGILESGSLWATHMVHMNDPEEMRYGHQLYEDAIVNALQRATDPEKEFLEKCGEHFNQQMNLEASLPAGFCASFSTKADDAHQWRNYAANLNGVCLAFDTKVLLDRLSQKLYDRIPTPLFQLVAMNYGSADQQRHVEKLVDGGIKATEQLHAVFGPADGDIIRYRIANTCMECALRLSTYFKSGKWKDENEWRVVPTHFGDPTHVRTQLDIRSRNRDGKSIEYTVVPLADEAGMIKSLKEIWVGPARPFDSARKELEALPAIQKMMSHGVSPEIKRSSLPQP